MRGTGSSGRAAPAVAEGLAARTRTSADLRDSDRGEPSGGTKREGRPQQGGETAPPAGDRAQAPRATDAPDQPSKVIYPDSHITKQEVADYYLAVMDHLLPEIVGRPLSMIRCPEGAGKPCFFQKHHTPGLEHVGLVRLKEEAGNNANYLVALRRRGRDGTGAVQCAGVPSMGLACR